MRGGRLRQSGLRQKPVGHGAQAFALDLRVIGLVEGEKACPVDPEEGRAAACLPPADRGRSAARRPYR